MNGFVSIYAYLHLAIVSVSLFVMIVPNRVFHQCTMPYYIRALVPVLLAGTRSDQTLSTSISQASYPRLLKTTQKPQLL